MNLTICILFKKGLIRFYCHGYFNCPNPAGNTAKP